MILRILLLVVIIAPLGLASDFDQDHANATGSNMGIITGGDIQSIDFVSDSPPEWENLTSITSYQDNDSRSYYLPGWEKLLAGIDPSDPDSELTPLQNIQDHMLANYARDLDGLTANDSDDKAIPIASFHRGDGISSKLLDIYNMMGDPELSSVESMYLEKDINSNQFNIDTHDDDGDSIMKDRIANANLNPDESTITYYYEENSKKDVFSTSAKDAARTIVSNFDRIHGNSDLVSYDSLRESGIDADTEASDIDYLTQYPDANAFFSELPDMNNIEESPALVLNDLETSGIMADVRAHMERIGQEDFDRHSVLNSYDISLQNKAGAIISLLDYRPVREARSHSSKNYAVVVGINSYSDRMSLHTSVNDADKMAALLESYGYEVIKLTDQTPDQPTKDNILDKALGGLKQKKDLGKVLIYFSGHGEKKGDDYYLIPQNSNGQISSYISAQELEQSIRGLKSVALVVDACNSGELEKIVDKGQLVLASSDVNEPSNEVWFGPLSLFTNNLFNAIKEEEKVSNAVSLERCFYKARDATREWSKPLLIGQTPQIKDETVGYFYLN